MRKGSQIFIPGLITLIIAAAFLSVTPAFTATLAGGQITYTAKNAAAGRTDIFLTDSPGGNTVNITESLPVGNINGFSWSPDGASLAFSDDRNIVYRLEMNTYDLEILAEKGFDPA